MSKKLKVKLLFVLAAMLVPACSSTSSSNGDGDPLNPESEAITSSDLGTEDETAIATTGDEEARENIDQVKFEAPKNNSDVVLSIHKTAVPFFQDLLAQDNINLETELVSKKYELNEQQLPVYFAWVVVNDEQGNKLTSGALKVTLKEKETYEISEFNSALAIRSNPDDNQYDYPLLVGQNIVMRAKFDQGLYK